jgi:chemotaxis protein CheY-P-specific phosphatase CheC
MELSGYEFDITRELISIALSNAADSFSKMANEKVLIQGFDVNVLNQQELSDVTQHLTSPIQYLLKTEIKGRVIGKSFLIFSTEEVQKVFDIFAPGMPGPAVEGELDEFQKAILLEFDNIICATVVTQLSNILSLFAYGDVPEIHVVPQNKVFDLLKSELTDFETILNVRAKFKTYNSQMTPSFVFFFKSTFLQAVKDLISQKQGNSLLKENK